jgi:glucosamine--fructose-6-phosphate aminotransferase (isomerizing)
MLQNRGYDSAGIATGREDGKIVLTKYASEQGVTALEKLKLHELEHKDHGWGIGHTRWATHGPKTDDNAHPHSSETKSGARVYVVHNGIIENYQELKEMLKSTRYADFTSDTDTEVIAALWAYEIDKTPTLIHGAFTRAIKYLKGTWAVAGIVENVTDTLYISKNGSPLMVGYDADNIWVASESLGFQKYTQKWLILCEGEVLSIEKKESGWIVHNETQHSIPIERFVPHDIYVDECKEALPSTPAPFRYWTEKEIHDQEYALWDVLNRGGRVADAERVKLGGLEMMSGDLLRLQHLVILGCGTSWHAGQMAAKVFKEISKFDTVQVFDASEFQFEDLPRQGKVGVLVISQSGETKDCHRIMTTLSETEQVELTLGVVNVVGSLIARETDCGVYLNAGREIGVASTKSFTCQVVALILVALWFAQRRFSNAHVRRKYISHVRLLPTLFARYREPFRQHVSNILPHLQGQRSMFLLGRHFSYPIVLEGALKIKELTYQNAEGFPGGGLKHGPFAVIDPGTPIFLHIWKGKFYDRMISAAEEVSSRGAYVIVLTNDRRLKPSRIMNHVVFVDVDDECFANLVSVMFYQYIALDLAVALGNNPDFPRNLAKVVTVDG